MSENEKKLLWKMHEDGKLDGEREAWATALYVSLTPISDLEKIFNDISNLKTDNIITDIFACYTPTQVRDRLNEYNKNKEDK